MISVTLARYLAAVMLMPLMIPLVLILVPRWCFSFRVMVFLAMALEVMILAGALVIYLLMGPTMAACLTAGYVLPFLCIPIFLRCSGLRGARLFFILVTISVDTTLCDLLASMIAPRSAPVWLLWKALITLGHAVPLWRYWRRPFWSMLEGSQTRWVRMSLLPLSLCAFLTVYYRQLIGPMGVRIPLFPPLLLCAAAILVYTTLYLFQRATLGQAETQHYNLLLRTKVGALQRQTNMAEHAMDNIRIFRHDLRHYVSLLRSALSSGDMASAQDILGCMEYSDALSTPWTALQNYTGDPLLDTVLTQAAERAQAEGVVFTVQLTLPQSLRVDMTEFAVVVSNALENAMTAAAQCPEGDRQVFIQDRPCAPSQQLFLVIGNSYATPPEIDPKTGLPQTEEPGHGQGTRSMAHFAQKYDCLLDFSLQGDRFYLRLLI